MNLNFPSLALVAAVLGGFSLTSLAAPETAAPPAGSGTAAAAAQAATPKTDAKPAKKAKTRALKSKKKKECGGKDYCE